MPFTSKSFITLLFILNFFLINAQDSLGKSKVELDKTLIVGYAGTEPFVIYENNNWKGISVEIWELIAGDMRIKFTPKSYINISDALNDLAQGKLDVVVGPTSITSERAELVEFSQPYFQSSLAIMSRTDSPSFFDRIATLFTINLLYALLIFLFILAIVGTLLWLAERKVSPEQFPHDPVKGIANGMWCAIVTMSTTGYGDIAPVTLMGRIVAGTWMVVSILFATTMVAGIASSLTLSALGKNTISSAEQFENKKIAVIKDSPAIDFVEEYDGKTVIVENLVEAHKLLKNKEVQGIVFDRPQLKYFLETNPDKHLTISVAEYLKQGYGFAFPLNSEIVCPSNIELLKLKEEGILRDVTEDWLGKEKKMD